MQFTQVFITLKSNSKFVSQTGRLQLIYLSKETFIQLPDNLDIAKIMKPTYDFCTLRYNAM
jgi:hypothetical protein